MTSEVLFGVSGPDDGFYTALRRRGWHLTSAAPFYNDANVIRWRTPFASARDEREHAGFYDAFADNTLRKVLRAIVGNKEPRSQEQLHCICGNEEKLRGILMYLEAGGIIEAAGDTWARGPQTQHIDNIGTTLEWYVAEWFRRELHAPARHGVTLKEVRRGGDLDVLAFVNDICMFVECKTSKPSDISETAIRWFLQRAHDFGPEIAVLLIDSDSSISKPARLTDEVTAELEWLEQHPEAAAAPTDVRQTVGTTGTVQGYKELYCAGGNVFLTGVTESIDASLSAALRFYYSYLRHQLIEPIPLEWDFVEGRVSRTKRQPFGIHGQLRMRPIPTDFGGHDE